MGKILEGLTGEFTKSAWVKVASPAFMFWLVGLLALSDFIHRPAPLTWLTEFIDKERSSSSVLIIGTAALLLVGASAWVVEHLTLGMIRFLEGYWPWWFGIRKWRTRAWMRRRADYVAELQNIEGAKDRSDDYWDRRTKLINALRRIPPEPFPVMPTRLGNVMSSAEMRPIGKYGLDAVTCWPRLWLLLPKDNKTDIGAARAALDDGARLWLWSALLLVWTPWLPFIAAVSVIGCYISYLTAVAAAIDYADLIEAVFDTKRMLLYDALGLPKPKSPAEEYQADGTQSTGTWLTSYLADGSSDARVQFEFAKKPAKPEPEPDEG